MFSSSFWWVLVGVGLMICEFVVPGLILFFFGAGALVTALVALFVPMSLTLQLTLFVIASLALLFGLRRLLKPVFMGRSTAVSKDSLTEGLAGAEGRVIAPIAPGAPGKVVLNGTNWKAEAEETLKVDQAVVVVSQRSLTLIVKPK